MSLLCWNCRGLGNPRSVQYLREIRRTKRPKIIFLCETFQRKGEIDRIIRELRNASCLEVEANGHSGGLALLWDDDITVSIQSYSRNHIDAKVEEGENKTWRFTGFYGYPIRSRHHKSWSLLQNLAAHSDLPWCIAGDFNCITSRREKQGGALYPLNNINAFCETLRSIQVHDLGYTGSLYTWRRGETFQMMDRAVANRNWIEMFPDFEVKILAPGP